MNDFRTNGCFPTGVGILAESGIKPVENIRIGDMILNPKWEPQKVIAVNSPGPEPELLILHGDPVDLKCSPNQLIYSLDPRAGLLYDCKEERRKAADMEGYMYAMPVSIGVTCPCEPVRIDRFCYWYLVRDVEVVNNWNAVYQFKTEEDGGFIADGIICF